MDWYAHNPNEINAFDLITITRHPGLGLMRCDRRVPSGHPVGAMTAALDRSELKLYSPLPVCPFPKFF